MTRLPAFLGELAAMHADIVRDFPDSCLPIRQGQVRQSLSHLVSSQGPARPA